MLLQSRGLFKTLGGKQGLHLLKQTSSSARGKSWVTQRQGELDTFFSMRRQSFDGKKFSGAGS